MQEGDHVMSRRQFFRSALTTTAACLAAAAGCARDESGWFELTRWRMTVKGLPAVFDGFRILQLTDIHYSEWMDRKRLMDLRSFVNDQQVDLIIVTGDSSYHTEDFADLVAFYEGMPQIAPVLMVFGNHDIWDGAEETFQQIFDLGVQLLRNDIYTISRNGKNLIIAGLDCAYEQRDDLQKVLSMMPEDDSQALLLVHEPDVAPACAQTGRFFLQLSGHSHGGQICLPNGYAPVLPYLGQHYPRGYYDIDGMMLYTCRGLGRGKPYIRLNCPAELALFTLAAGSENDFQPM
jgi:predicted MPP superfamily phosphohydrolase